MGGTGAHVPPEKQLKKIMIRKGGANFGQGGSPDRFKEVLYD